MNQASGAPLRVIGLMSGTSADGIDAALVEIRGSGPEAQVALKAHQCYSYRSKMLEAIFSAFTHEGGGVDRVIPLSFALGELLAAAATNLVKEAGISMADVDIIGSHGQTIRHSPEQTEIGGMWTVSTLQIGEPAVIAERTGVTVVADFRPSDMAAGGQGAPLVPYADYVLFRSANRTRGIQNIGGIGNVTYIPSGSKLNGVTAFDTGPGNMLIDAIVTRLTGGKQRCDTDGKMASAGTPDRIVLGHLLDHPYLQKHPPKSTGREEFGTQFADEILGRWPDLSPNDMVATVTAFTARSIQSGYEHWLPKMPDDIIVGGGGVRNPALMKMLAEAFPNVRVYTHEDFGVYSDAKEAIAFALLANETIRFRPTNVPSATGAERSVVLGKIVPGRNYMELINRIAGGA